MRFMQPEVGKLSGPPDTGAAGLDDVTVIVPAFNEAGSLEHLLEAIPPSIGEVIVVDGVSTDQTMRVARSFGGNVWALERTRRGKGNALACGIAAASGQICVTLDGDGSASPLEIPALVNRLREGADFVKGSRFRGAGFRAAGAMALTRYFNAHLGSDVTDVCCGFTAFDASLASSFRLDPDSVDTKQHPDDGFEIEAVLLGRALLAGARVAEVGVSFLPRSAGTTKLRPLVDGARIAHAIHSMRDAAIS